MMKNAKVLKWTVYATIFSGLGFMLLLSLVVLERSAFGLLIGQIVGPEDIRNVFNGLKLVVHVLPFTLGPLIIGSMFNAVRSLRLDLKKVRRAVPIALFAAVMLWNIFGADTAAVVQGLKSTTPDQSIDDISYIVKQVMLQHHLGLFAFAQFFVQHLVLLIREISAIS
ncbi:MAG: hypothetical protein VW851_07210 [Cryomorphaceae bacterium]|jgi:hypothetical protein